MDKKIEVIKKELKNKCFCCDGKGCKTCNNSGIYKEYYYIFIVNGYAIGADTLK